MRYVQSTQGFQGFDPGLRGSHETQRHIADPVHTVGCNPGHGAGCHIQDGGGAGDGSHYFDTKPEAP